MSLPVLSSKFGRVPPDVTGRFWTPLLGHRAYAVELHPHGEIGEWVALWAVVQLDARTTRAMVLHYLPETHGWKMEGRDSDKLTVTTFLREQGVPVLRIGRLLT